MATDRSRSAGKSPIPTVELMAGRPKRAAGGRDLYHGLTPRYSDTFAIFLLKARRREKDHDRVTAEQAGKRGAPNVSRTEMARRIAFALRLGGQEIAKGAAPKDNASPHRTMHRSHEFDAERMHGVDRRLHHRDRVVCSVAHRFSGSGGPRRPKDRQSWIR